MIKAQQAMFAKSREKMNAAALAMPPQASDFKVEENPKKIKTEEN